MSHAQPEVYLSVRAGGSPRQGVGIAGFQPTAGIGDLITVRETLERDIEYSGIFSAVSMPDSIARRAAGMFEQWGATDARYLILGEESRNGRAVAVKMFEIASMDVILSGEYRIDTSRPWQTAHVLVDDIIEMFTGVRGSMGSSISFIRDTGNGQELFLMDADGHTPRQMTFSGTINLSPSWSPAGERIAYSSLQNDNWQLMTISVESGQQVRLSEWPGLNTAPDWSPVDTNLIAFTASRDGNAEIYTCRADGSQVVRLTNHPRIDSSPTWSPDGRRIAFASDRTGRPLVYVMNRDGSGLRRLTSTPNAYEDLPSWSPLGDRIAFVVTSDYGTFDIATSNAQGGDVLILTYGAGTNEDPAWSPDGLQIVFSSTRSGQRQIYAMNWDGTHVRQLTRAREESYSPSWAPADSGDDIRISLETR